MPQPAKQRTLSSFLVSREKLSSLPSHPNLSLPSLPPFPPGDDETPSSDLTNRRTSTLSDYRLLAVTRHTGLARPELVARAAFSSQASAGHYVCDIFDVSDGNWRTFEDSIVRKVRHLLSTALFSLLNRGLLSQEDWPFIKERAAQDGYLLFFVHSSVLPDKVEPVSHL